MYRLTVRDHVMIAHSLPDPAFGPAQGLHGATFVVEATFHRAELNEHAIVLDIGVATAALAAVLADLAYRNLDEHPDLAGQLTTTERLARFVADRLAGHLANEMPGHGVTELDVVLREHPDAWAGYTRSLA